MSFAGGSVGIAYACEIAFPGHTLRYVEAGEFVFNGDVFTSYDSVFGKVDSFEDIVSGLADSAPIFEMDFTPPDATAAADLSSPDFQGSVIKVYKWAYDRETGLVQTSETKFTGVVDTSTISGDIRQFTVTMTFVTEIQKFFNTDKGNRLNDAFHQSIFPGELGLQHTTGTTIPQPWGQKSQQRYGGGGGVGGVVGVGVGGFIQQ